LSHKLSSFLSGKKECYHELRIIKIYERKIHNISQYASHLVILSEAEGEVAESMTVQLTLALRERGAVADGG